MRSQNPKPFPTTFPTHSPMLSPHAFQTAMSPSPASVQHRDEPVHGWKSALLVKDARNMMFRAVTLRAFYTAGRQRFICHCLDAQFPPILRVPHQKPTVGDDSSCGWYAMKNKHDSLQVYNARMARSPHEMNAWLLEVDLWGQWSRASAATAANTSASCPFSQPVIPK